jgi:hypothetical protein
MRRWGWCCWADKYAHMTGMLSLHSQYTLLVARASDACFETAGCGPLTTWTHSCFQDFQHILYTRKIYYFIYTVVEIIWSTSQSMHAKFSPSVYWKLGWWCTICSFLRVKLNVVLNWNSISFIFIIVILWFVHNIILHEINPIILSRIFLLDVYRTEMQLIHGSLKQEAHWGYHTLVPDKFSHNSFTLICAAGGVEKAEKVMAWINLWKFHTDVQTT